MTTATPPDRVPNHHAGHAPFRGLRGVLAAATMTVGREGDAALAIELAGVESGDRVVDVGCGPGTAVRRAARAGARVTGIDPAPVMLQTARRFGGGDRVTYVEGRAEALPVPDASADAVWSIASVHHWPDLDGGIAEARRVLVPGGRFVALERRTRPGATGHASHGWTDDQAEAFAARCRTAGFSEVRVEPRQAGRRSLVAVVGTRR
jgi:ubiquinone/menaquinone biosynthesis C-methylase UbiE